MCFFIKFKIKRLTRKIKTLQYNRLHNQANGEALKNELELYHYLGDMLASLQGHHKFPYAREMARECYRTAASLDDKEAQYRLAKALIEEAKYRDQLQQEALFASQGNARLMQQQYEEGLAFLLAADQNQHAKAKRLHGLCYIYGWGVPIDKKRGFELVVASIEQENNWDKVPQIFAEIGLNKPEFYSALTQHRQKI